MANLVGYVANVAKSVGYSLQDNVTEFMPNTSEFVQTNAEVFKSVYDDIRHFKLTLKRTSSSIQNSKIYEALDVGYHGLLEDLKNGTFYNRKRIDEITKRAMGSLGDMSDDQETSDILNRLESGDDFSLDDNTDIWNDDEDNVDLNDLSSLDEGDQKIVKSNIVGSELVSDTVVKTGKYLVDSQKVTNNLMYTQSIKNYNMIQNNLDKMNQNIASIVELGNLISTNIENTTKYYTDSMQQLQDQTALLRKISESLDGISANQENNDEEEDLSFRKIVSSKGMPNLAKYKKLIKRNIKNKLSDFDMLNAMGDDSNILLTFAASPLQSVMNALTKQIIPTKMKKGMKRMDGTLSSFFGALMGKLNYMSNSDSELGNDKEVGFIAKTISDILGIKSEEKNTLDTGAYQKGRMFWNGKSDRTLNEVIPTYLRKILSAITGTEERIYDYDRGNFVKGSTIKEEFESNRKGAIERATSEIRKEFSEFLENGVKYKNDREKQSVKDDLKVFLEKLYNDEYIDLNNDEKYSDYGISPRNYIMFSRMFRKLDKQTQMRTIGKILREKASLYETMQNMEKNPDAIARNLFNDSNINEFIEFKTDRYGRESVDERGGKSGVNWLKNSTDDNGNNVFYYLENLYREVYSIRNNMGFSSSSVNSRPSNRSENIGMFVNGVWVETPHKYTPTDLKINDSYEYDKHNKEYLSSKEFEAEQNKIIKEYQERYSGPIADLSKIKNRTKNVTDDVEGEINFAFETFEQDREKEFNAKDKLKENEKNFIDKLLEKKNIFGKMQVMNEYFNKIATKPVKAFDNMVNKIDQRLYEVIFGKPDGDEEKSFMARMGKEIKNSFQKLNDWLDNALFKKLKEKMKIKSMKDIPGKIFESIFHQPFDEAKQKIRDYLFEKDEGLFPKIGHAIKDTFTGAFDGVKTAFSSVKDSIAETLSPITSRFKKDNKDYVETNTRHKSHSSSVVNKAAEKLSSKNKKELKAKYLKEQRKQEKEKQEYLKNRKHKNYVFENIGNALGLDLNNGIVEDGKTSKLNTKMIAELLGTGFDQYGNMTINEDDLNNITIQSIQDKLQDKLRLQNALQGYIDFINKADMSKLSVSKAFKYNSIKYFLNHKSKKYGLNDKDKEELEKIYNKLKNSKHQLITVKDVKNELSSKTGKYDYLQSKLQDIMQNSNPDLLLRDLVYRENINTPFGPDPNILNQIQANEAFGEKTENNPILATNNTFISPVVKLLSSINKGLYYIIPMIQEKTGFGVKTNNTTGKTDTSKIEKLFSKYQRDDIPNPDDPNYTEQDAKKRLIDSIMHGIFTSISDPITNLQEFSTGGTDGKTPVDEKSGKVNKTDVVTISEGESITNVKTTENINDAINEIIKKNKEYKQIVREIYSLLTGRDEIKESVVNDIFNNKKVMETIDEVAKNKEGSSATNIQNALLQNKYIGKDEYLKAIEPYKAGDTFGETSRKALIEAGESTRRFVDKTYEILFNDKLDDKKFKAATDDISKNIKDYMPGMVGGGLLGGGLSLLTGMIGGPLIGAAAGASISLVKNSNKLQNFLFGEKINGDYQGGFFDKNFVNTIAKTVPDLKNFGIVGGVSGLLPFLPFGPIGGMMLGAGVGFLKNTQFAKDNLFGNMGDNPNSFMKKAMKTIKKAAPVTIATLIPSLMVGPFGFLGNTLLSASVGLLSTTDKFKEFVFGKKSKTTGKYENGLLPSMRDHLINPIKKFMARAKFTVSDWIKKNITDQLKDAIKPMFRQLKIAGKSVVGLIGGALNKVFEKSVGVPFGKFVDEKIIKPASSIVKKIINGALSPIKFAISAPFKIFGAMGRHLEKRQVEKGTAEGTSASERLGVWKKIGKFGRLNQSLTGQYNRDKAIAAADDESILLMYDQMSKIMKSKDDYAKDKKDIESDVGNEVSAYFEKYGSILPGTRKGAKDVAAAFKAGDTETVKQLINEEKAYKDTEFKNLQDTVIKYTNKVLDGKNPKFKSTMKKLEKGLDPEQYKQLVEALRKNDTEKATNILKSVKEENDKQFTRLSGFIDDKTKEHDLASSGRAITQNAISKMYKDAKKGNPIFSGIVSSFGHYYTNEGTVQLNCSLYEKADEKSKVITTIPKGSKVTVIDEVDGFYKVKYNSKKGFVVQHYVVRGGTVKVNEKKEKQLFQYLSDELKSRGYTPGNKEDVLKSYLERDEKTLTPEEKANKDTIERLNTSNNFLESINDAVIAMKAKITGDKSAIYDKMSQSEKDAYDKFTLQQSELKSHWNATVNKKINNNFEQLTSLYKVTTTNKIVHEEDMYKEGLYKVYSKSDDTFYYISEGKDYYTKGIRVPGMYEQYVYKCIKFSGGSRDNRLEMASQANYDYINQTVPYGEKQEKQILAKKAEILNSVLSKSPLALPAPEQKQSMEDKIQERINNRTSTSVVNQANLKVKNRYKKYIENPNLIKEEHYQHLEELNEVYRTKGEKAYFKLKEKYDKQEKEIQDVMSKYYGNGVTKDVYGDNFVMQGYNKPGTDGTNTVTPVKTGFFKKHWNGLKNSFNDIRDRAGSRLDNGEDDENAGFIRRKLNKLGGKIKYNKEEGKFTRFAEDGTPLVYKEVGEDDLELDLSDAKTADYANRMKAQGKEVKATLDKNDNSLVGKIANVFSDWYGGLKQGAVGKIIGKVFGGVKSVLKYGGIAVGALSGLGAIGYAKDYIAEFWDTKFKPWISDTVKPWFTEKVIPWFKNILPTIGSYISQGLSAVMDVVYNSADSIVSKAVDVVLKVGPKLIWALCKKGLSMLPVIGSYFDEDDADNDMSVKSAADAAIRHATEDANKDNTKEQNNAVKSNDNEKEIGNMVSYYTDYQNNTGDYDNYQYIDSGNDYYRGINNNYYTNPSNQSQQMNSSTSNNKNKTNTSNKNSSNNGKWSTTTYQNKDGSQTTLQNSTGLLYNKDTGEIYNEEILYKDKSIEPSNIEKIRDASGNAIEKSFLAGLQGFGAGPLGWLNNKLSFKNVMGGSKIKGKVGRLLNNSVKVTTETSNAANRFGNFLRNNFLNGAEEGVDKAIEKAAENTATSSIPKSMEKGVWTSVENTAKQEGNKVIDFAQKKAEKEAAKKVAEETTKTVAEKAAESTEKLTLNFYNPYDELGRKAVDKTTEKGTKTVTEKAIEKTAETTVEESTKKPSMIKKLFSKFTELLKKIGNAIKNQEVIKYLLGKSKAEKLGEALKITAENITKHAGDLVKAASESTIGKAIKGIMSAIPSVLIKIAIMTGYFISGYNDAADYLDVLKPTGGEKVACGLLNMLMNLPFPYIWLIGLFPSKTMMQIIEDGVLPLFGTSKKELEQRKKEAVEATNVYNEMYGTDYTQAEYVDKVLNPSTTGSKAAKRTIIESEKTSETKKKSIETIITDIKAKLQNVFKNSSVQGLLTTAIKSQDLNKCINKYIEKLEDNLWNCKVESQISVVLGGLNKYSDTELSKMFVQAYNEASKRDTSGLFSNTGLIKEINFAGALTDVNNTSLSDDELKQERINVYVAVSIGLIVLKILGTNCPFADIQTLVDFIKENGINSGNKSRNNDKKNDSDFKVQYGALKNGLTAIKAAANKLYGEDNPNFIGPKRSEVSLNTTTSSTTTEKTNNNTKNEYSYLSDISDTELEKLARILDASSRKQAIYALLSKKYPYSQVVQESNYDRIDDAVNKMQAYLGIGGSDASIGLYNATHKNKVNKNKIIKLLKKKSNTSKLGVGGEPISESNVIFDDLTAYPTLDSSTFNSWIQAQTSSYDNLFKRWGVTGDYLNEVGKSLNIDPRFIAALAKTETGYGNTSSGGTGIKYNNPFGYGVPETSGYKGGSAPNDKTAIKVYMEKIKKDFFDYGYHSLYALSKNKDGHAYNIHDYWVKTMANYLESSDPSVDGEDYQEDPWVTKFDVNKSKALDAVQKGYSTTNLNAQYYPSSQLITNSGKMPSSTLLSSDEITWGETGSANGSSDTDASTDNTEKGISGFLSSIKNMASGVAGNIFGDLLNTSSNLSSLLTSSLDKAYGLDNYSYNSDTAEVENGMKNASDALTSALDKLGDSNGDGSGESINKDRLKAQTVDVGGVDRITKKTLQSNKPADAWFNKTLGSVKSSNYGWRMNPISTSSSYGEPSWHEGIDYATGNKAGQDIKSPISGKVVYINKANAKDNKNKTGYGNAVGIEDENHKIHLFGHMLNPVKYKVGNRIKVGDAIGKIGSTGASTGNHLHYGIYDKSMKTGTDIDPNAYLASLKNKGKGGEDIDRVEFFKDINSDLNKNTKDDKALESMKKITKSMGKGGSKLQEVKLDQTTLLLIKSIINILSKEVENTNTLKEIKQLLSNKLTLNATKKNTTNKSEVMKSIKKAVGMEGTPVNSDNSMVELLNLLASE